jgi:hypothetical protein
VWQWRPGRTGLVESVVAVLRLVDRRHDVGAQDWHRGVGLAHAPYAPVTVIQAPPDGAPAVVWTETTTAGRRRRST